MTFCPSPRGISLAVLVALWCGQALAQVPGVVAVGEGKCQRPDRVVIATNLGFTLGEQYSGNFDKDDKVYGALNSYGFKDVLVNESAGRLYIDDYMASRDKAKTWCFGDE
jgi:hypothetical protein